ncbi:MAG: RNA pyrophosphohydrolase, partial [Lentilitoribacter sp.]
MVKKIKAEDLPYRPCVGIMVLNLDGLVWAGKRISNNDRDEYKDEPFKWQMPQGGIDKGEDPEPASLRELYEETGMKSVEFIAESQDWLTYDLPDDL